MTTNIPDVSKFRELYAEFLGRDESKSERALFYLLDAYQKDLPDLSNPEWFHKAFRQTDVTGNGKIDMAIWLLIGQSDVVWDVLETFNRGGTSVFDSIRQF